MRTTGNLPALMAAAVLLAPATGAQVRVWTGLGGNNLWTNALNWSDNDVPDTPDEDAHVDNDGDKVSTPGYRMPAGAMVSIGSLTVDSDDSATIDKVTLNESSSASFIIAGALDNGGVLTTGGTTGSNKTHGNSFSVTVQGGGGETFNRAGATIYAKSLTGYRRTTSDFRLPAGVTNEGDLYVQCLTGEGGGIMRFHLMGEGSRTFVNNGRVLVEGRGYSSGGNQPWCVFGPGNTNQILTIGGTGTVVLASSLGSRTDSYAILTGHMPGCSVSNAATHTVRGSGYFGRGGSNGSSSGKTSVQSLSLVVNAGLILGEASSSVSNLFIAASGGSVVNLSGARIVSATTNTQVWIGSHVAAGTFRNDGLLEARSGAAVVLATNLATTLNGELRGGGAFVGSPTVTLAAATLMPGDSENDDGTGGSTVGTLTVDGNLVFDAAGTLALQLGPAGTAGVDYDNVVVTGSLTLDGTVEVVGLDGYGRGGRRYRIMSFAPGTLVDNGLDVGAVPPGSFAPRVVVDDAAGAVYLEIAPPTTLIVVR
jgi:fibronectin-binding autotransporter adhesin